MDLDTWGTDEKTNNIARSIGVTMDSDDYEVHEPKKPIDWLCRFAVSVLSILGATSIYLVGTWIYEYKILQVFLLWFVLGVVCCSSYLFVLYKSGIDVNKDENESWLLLLIPIIIFTIIIAHYIVGCPTGG